MIWILKMFCIFELLLKFNSNGAITETKTKRRPTVASTAVIFMHRMDLGSRDLLPLFHPNHFIMLPKNDKCPIGQNVAVIAKKNHKLNRGSITYTMLQKSVPELVAAFQIEMDCKNQAYYFILENGHFNDFRDYCQKERGIL